MEYPRKTSARARNEKPSVGGEENKQMNNKHEKSIKKARKSRLSFLFFSSFLLLSRASGAPNLKVN
jgi:hypothetical protein